MNKKLKNAMMLFRFFFRIGWFTFGGGWSIVTEMEREYVTKKQILTKEDLLDITSVGRSLPGVMIANVSWIFGYRVGGFICAIAATVGVVLPSVLILTVVAKLYVELKDNIYVAGLLVGVGSAVVPIILTSALSLGKVAMKERVGYFLCGVALFLSVCTDIGNVPLIVMAVVLGLIKTGVNYGRVS